MQIIAIILFVAHNFNMVLVIFGREIIWLHEPHNVFFLTADNQIGIDISVGDYIAARLWLLNNNFFVYIFHIFILYSVYIYAIF